MTVKTGAVSAKLKWDAIDWQTVNNQVRRLQMRIAKAVREKKYGKAKALQWILTHSFYPKLLAIKRISENKGSKTPGIDGVIWNTAKKKMDAVRLLKRRGYKPKALRRIYIPKKNGKFRPLSIPCTIDKAQQALHLLGLEPISESIVDVNSYGFRPKRSCADAIEQCFLALCRRKSAEYVLEGDIKSCFDKIGHKWLLKNVPMDKQILKKWITAGYIDKGIFYHTEEGLAQGGVISPTLMLITLAGLEKTVLSTVPTKYSKINVIAYADDFIITGVTKDILENKIKPAVQKFLAERGLQLSEKKTKITHIQEGFDFLGFNIRKYKQKLLIKPSKQNVLEYLKKTREVIKKLSNVTAGELIATLNPKIKGWGNYYRHSVAKNTFKYIDNNIFHAIFRWCLRKHPNKSKTWIVKKYFSRERDNNWRFTGTKTTTKGQIHRLLLESMNQIPILRHKKIIGKATPYDPVYTEYFNKRITKKSRNTWTVMPITA